MKLITGLLCILYVYNNDFTIQICQGKTIYVYYYLFFRNHDPKGSISFYDVSMYDILALDINT